MDQYEFGVEFQDQIAALVLKDHSLIISVRSVIEERYFTDPSVRRIVGFATEFIQKYMAPPSRQEFTEFISGRANKEVLKKANQLFRLKIKNPKYVRDSIIEFAQYQSMRQAIIASSELVGSYENHLKISALVKESLRIGIDTRDIGTDLVKDRITRIREREQKGLFQTRITTGLDKLDSFMNGGLDVGEEGIVLAPPKGFKTGTLLGFGAAAASARKKVVHYTLEISEENMSLRYDRRFSGLTKSEILTSASKLEKSLKIIESIGGGILIKGYPMRTITVDHLHNHLSFLQTEGMVPDVIIVDYGDLLKPSGSGEYRHQLSQIYAELRGLGQEHKAALWSASQANRKSTEKKIIRKEDISEDFGKVAIADAVIAVCQTPEEHNFKPLARARLFIAANREGEEGGIVYTSVDYDRMRMRQLNEEYEEDPE